MSSARDKVRAGENVVAEVPVVIPDVASHDTAFCCHAFTMSLKECGAAAGSPAKRHKNAASSALVRVRDGENVVGEVPVVTPWSSSQATAGDCHVGRSVKV